MQRRSLILLGLVLLVACSPAPEGPIQRAGVVIRHADGSTAQACVQFSQASISGEELLRRSGIEYAVDSSNPMGVMLCSIDGEGCEFPAEKCLCGCDRPGACAYWSYFRRPEGGDWVYSPAGASARRVEAGDLDAWVWTAAADAGSSSIRQELEGIRFSDVCR